MAWILSQDKMMVANIGFLSLKEVEDAGAYILVGSAGPVAIKPVGMMLILGRFSSRDRAQAVIRDFIGHLDTRGMVGAPGAYHVPSDDVAMMLV